MTDTKTEETQDKSVREQVEEREKAQKGKFTEGIKRSLIESDAQRTARRAQRLADKDFKDSDLYADDDVDDDGNLKEDESTETIDEHGNVVNAEGFVVRSAGGEKLD